MPKQEKLPPRPKEPTTAEMHIDLTTTAGSDIAFMIFRDDGNDNSSTESANLMSESFVYNEDIADKTKVGSGLSIPPEEDGSEQTQQKLKLKERDSIFNETVQFIEISESLKDAPESLKNKYQQLSKLGIQLKESIESLKRHSQDALNCSVHSDESTEDLK